MKSILSLIVLLVTTSAMADGMPAKCTVSIKDSNSSKEASATFDVQLTEGEGDPSGSSAFKIKQDNGLSILGKLSVSFSSGRAGNDNIEVEAGNMKGSNSGEAEIRMYSGQNQNQTSLKAHCQLQ